jgi:hypothetical protein
MFLEQVMSSRKLFAVLIVGLLLIAGQVAALVHAAEHPFHTPDETCAAFAHFERNDHAVAVLLQIIESQHIADITDISLTSIFINQTCLFHRPRAPPIAYLNQ